MGFRVGIYKRVLADEMKNIEKQKFDTPQEKEDAIEDAKYKAAARARGIMDFSQGGYITKTLDIGMPYLNAASQALYTSARRTVEHKADVAIKAAQAVAVFSSATYLTSLALFSSFGDDEEDPKKELAEAYEMVSDYTKRKYFVIMTPKKDKEGNYMYIKIKKTQNLTPLFATADFYIENELRKVAGKPPLPDSKRERRVSDAVANDVSPIDYRSPWSIPERNPMLSAMIAYGTGYDYFREKPVSYDVGRVQKSMEGYYDSRTEDFYKKLSDEFDMSPARTKAAVEKIITSPSTDPYVAGLYGVAEATTGDSPKDALSKLVEELISGFGKRLGGKTSKYVQAMERNEALKKEFDALEKKKLKETKLVNKYADELYRGDVTKKEAVANLKEAIKNADPEDQKAIVKRFFDRLNHKDVPEIYLTLKYEREPEKQALIFAYNFGLDISNDEKKDIAKYFSKINFRPSKEFQIELARLQAKLLSEEADKKKGVK